MSNISEIKNLVNQHKTIIFYGFILIMPFIIKFLPIILYSKGISILIYLFITFFLAAEWAKKIPIISNALKLHLTYLFSMIFYSYYNFLNPLIEYERIYFYFVFCYYIFITSYYLNTNKILKILIFLSIFSSTVVTPSKYIFPEEEPFKYYKNAPKKIESFEIKNFDNETVTNKIFENKITILIFWNKIYNIIDIYEIIRNINKKTDDISNINFMFVGVKHDKSYIENEIKKIIEDKTPPNPIDCGIMYYPDSIYKNTSYLYFDETTNVLEKFNTRGTNEIFIINPKGEIIIEYSDLESFVFDRKNILLQEIENLRK